MLQFAFPEVKEVVEQVSVTAGNASFKEAVTFTVPDKVAAGVPDPLAGEMATSKFLDSPMLTDTYGVWVSVVVVVYLLTVMDTGDESLVIKLTSPL